MNETQLTLAVNLRAQYSFANFIPKNNETVVNALQQFFEIEPSFIYLYATPVVGRSHLLQASLMLAESLKKTAIGLPFSKIENLYPEMLSGLENYDLICIDDVECAAGKKNWEEALFHLYNRIDFNRTKLLITSHCAPDDADFTLKDLISRFNHALKFQLRTLDDAAKILALQQRAKDQGFYLEASVAKYMLTHLPRDLHALFDFLEKIDHKQLQSQKNLSIAWVKTLI